MHNVEKLYTQSTRTKKRQMTSLFKINCFVEIQRWISQKNSKVHLSSRLGRVLI